MTDEGRRNAYCHTHEPFNDFDTIYVTWVARDRLQIRTVYAKHMPITLETEETEVAMREILEICGMSDAKITHARKILPWMDSNTSATRPEDAPEFLNKR